MKILLQGAMDEEINHFIDYFKPHSKKTIYGYDFFVASYKNNSIILSKTREGIINATLSTTLALQEFSPDIVINQGAAGAHSTDLHIGDIVVGESCVYMNDFKTKPRGKSEGSNPFDWFPNKKRSYVVESSLSLVDLAKNISFNSKIVCGRLGSGDLSSKEYDRIMNLEKHFCHLSEDMESVASMKVSETFGKDHIAIRIISNNELLLEKLDFSICKNLQKFIILLVDKILNNQ